MPKVYHSDRGSQRCAVCGEEFNKRAGARYCSKKCYNKVYCGAPTDWGIRRCATCGEEFDKRAGSIYCSQKCYQKIYYGVPKATKVCVVCGKEFIANFNTQKTCGSNSCTCALYRRENLEHVKKSSHDRFAKAHPRKSYSKVCAFCGASFETLYNTKKYCSGKCNIKRYRRSEKHKLIAVIDFHKRREDKDKSDYSAKDWHFALDFFKRSCAYCGKKARLHQDHFIPLKLGGSYVRGNILPACAACNYKKNAKHPNVFLQSFENRIEILEKINEFFLLIDAETALKKSPLDSHWRLNNGI